MTQRVSLFTVLLAALAVGCATSGSLGALRADHDKAEVARVRAEAEAAAAAKRQADAEARRTEAGKALANGLVRAATDDVKAAEAAAERAKAKRAEACKLNPDLPECKADQPPPAASPPADPAPPTPKADPAPAQPKPDPAAAQPKSEPEEAPAPAADEEEATDAEPPHAHIRLVKGDGNKTLLTFVQPLPAKWKVDWKSRGVLAVTIGEKEAYTVKADRLGIDMCWRLGISDEGAAVVSEEQCPSAEGE